MAFSDVERLLGAFGFSHRKGKGSHHFFWRGDLQISVATVHGTIVKRAYVRRIVALLNLEDWDDEENTGKGEDEQNTSDSEPEEGT